MAVSVADDVNMLEDIGATFRALDDKGDGRVPYSTFVEYLQSGGFELTDTEMDVLISQMDVEQAGCASCFFLCSVSIRYVALCTPTQYYIRHLPTYT